MLDPNRLPDEALAAAVGGEHRSAEARARDEYRHPAQTLEFFQIADHMTVVELWPGSGWYTEILAPFLRERGKLVAASFGAGAEPEYRAGIHAKFMELLEAEPEIYDRVEVIPLAPPDQIALGEPGSADVVLTFRNTHNWIEAGVEETVYRAAYDVLKPGGVFGVVQHRGEPGWNVAESAPRGYVPERHVIELAEQIGFELAASSEINANPKDTKDYEEGVWTLPPSFRLKDQDRERYAAIGESDRMTLRFRKPME
ncbi:MAG: class I SAM-dependent methyltransferase [Gammaproteobacteria bacterium]|nr:class I SAM-dependent methyltransferase [Gammaproteobacteria bacterium]